MADPLSKLFSSTARVKLLRLFLFNPTQSFTVPDAATRARVTLREAKREVALLRKIKLLRRARTRAPRYELNDEFEYLASLQQLLLNAPARGEDIAESLRKVGTMKLIVLSGIFLGEWESSLDMLIVGDRVVERKLRERVRRLESELGRELRYTLLSSEDFLYRVTMRDHLVRDVLDYPHRIALDRLGIAPK